MLEFKDALERVLNDATVTNYIERIPLLGANNKILSEDISSPISVPAFNNSAMDGFAVKADLINKNESYFISQRITAGDIATPLEEGTVARIFTGAMMPENADAVIMQENAKLSEDNNSVIFIEDAKQGINVRLKGEDILENSLALCRGRKLTVKDIAKMASMGFDSVPCYGSLTVAIFSTGDELISPGEKLRPGEIYNSNRYALSIFIQNLGCKVLDLGNCPDNKHATEKMIEKALELADCVISTGGMSVGEEDYVGGVLKALGNVEFWKLAIKPGKPFAFGEIKGTPFFGLPGNPVSAYVTFRLLVMPWLLKTLGSSSYMLDESAAESDFAAKNNGKRLEFLRGKAVLNNNGKIKVSLYPKQGSGILSSIVESNILIPIEPGGEISKSDVIKIIPLHQQSLVLDRLC